jgi:hypothetical protein
MFVFCFCLNTFAQLITPDEDTFYITLCDVLEQKARLTQAFTQLNNADVSIRSKLAFLSSSSRKDFLQVVTSSTAKIDKARDFLEQVKSDLKDAITRHNDASNRLVEGN